MAPTWLNGKRPSKPTTRSGDRYHEQDTPKTSKIIEVDEAKIRDHLVELVRGSVEETLNSLLDADVSLLGSFPS